VALMDSEIQVQSRSGEGSIFSFTANLLIADEWLTLMPVSQGKILGYEGEPINILVVDDRWENRSVIKNLLEPLNFAIFEAEDGVEGWQKVTTMKPDIIITDLSMPGIGGLELLRRIRQTKDLQSMIAIASSAHVFEADQNQSLEAGANAFLPKPIQSEELLQLIQTQLQLTWIYQDETAKLQDYPNQFNQIIDTSEVIALSNDKLELLRDLALSGRLQLLKHKVRDLVETNQCSSSFAEMIYQLVDQFAVEKIQLLIEHYAVASQPIQVRSPTISALS
jgi:CheY-like chemotaxis protein